MVRGIQYNYASFYGFCCHSSPTAWPLFTHCVATLPFCFYVRNCTPSSDVSFALTVQTIQVRFQSAGASDEEIRA